MPCRLVLAETGPLSPGQSAIPIKFLVPELVEDLLHVGSRFYLLVEHDASRREPLYASSTRPWNATRNPRSGSGPTRTRRLPSSARKASRRS
jgi:hypothetical protein